MALFSPLTLRGITLPNRIALSPMCMYSCEDGYANDWHMVHLGARAVGGVGLVMAEATAVVPEGRITPNDLGLWKDDHVEPLIPITRFIHAQGAYAAVQIAHAGRKAGTARPWAPKRGPVPIEEGGWVPVGPSPIRFREDMTEPHELTAAEIAALQVSYRHAARRAREAGFSVLEIHSAHGYLMHQFLSPISNRRTDAYGGSLENRCRMLIEVARECRREWPEHLPMFVRISSTDWVEGGWTIDDSVFLARQLKSEGVDLIDCSSGGSTPDAAVPVGPGFQVPFAERIRREAGVATGAVGMITEPAQADAIVRDGRADLVFVGRELLRDPHWALRAARELGVEVPWSAPYSWAVGPSGAPIRPAASIPD